MSIFESYMRVKLSQRIACVKENSIFVIIEVSSNHIRRIITGSVTIDTTLPASFCVSPRRNPQRGISRISGPLGQECRGRDRGGKRILRVYHAVSCGQQGRGSSLDRPAS